MSHNSNVFPSSDPLGNACSRSLQCTHPHKLHDLENLTTPTEGEKGPLQSSDILGSRIGTPSAPVWSPGAAKHRPEEGAMRQARETKGCLDWHQRSKHSRWELKPQPQSQYSRDRCLILPHPSQLEGAQGGSGQEAGSTPALTPQDNRRGTAVDTKKMGPNRPHSHGRALQRSCTRDHGSHLKASVLSTMQKTDGTRHAHDTHVAHMTHMTCT